MNTHESITIEPREDGPLVVKGQFRIRGVDGSELETKPVTALCRCGNSKTKPYCDGSHKTSNFKSSDDTQPTGRDRLIAYEGGDVTLTYNPRLCSHAAECGRIAGHIFDPTQTPWIQPDKGSRAEIEAVVAACPSGALALSGPNHLFPQRAEIEVQKDGPYWVLEARIAAPPAGEGASAEKYVLCRCGLSGNKPYCDGTHRDKGWISDD